jgi:predicted phage tail protein
MRSLIILKKMETAEEKPVKIFLGGKLGKLFGFEWSLFIKSPAEAIRAINANTKGEFLRYIEKRGVEKYYKISINSTKNRISEKELTKESDISILYISPIIKGNSSGIGKIIAGVVLIIIGAILIYTGIGAGFGAYAINLGVGLIVGGIIQLLTPMPTPPKDRGDTQTAQSKLLSTPNSIEQGSPLPIIYGRGLASSIPVSVSTSSYDTVTYSPPIPDEGYEESYNS